MPLQNLRLLALFGLLALPACGRDKAEKSVSVFQALPNLPLPPASEVLSRSGTPEALQITFRSALPPENLVEYYRTTLSKGEWDLVGDETDAEGARVLYAERDGPPMWVRIYPASGAEGTIIEISGAVPKAAAPGDSAADSTARPPA
jgi:hypothetical protein